MQIHSHWPWPNVSLKLLTTVKFLAITFVAMSYIVIPFSSYCSMHKIMLQLILHCQYLHEYYSAILKLGLYEQVAIPVSYMEVLVQCLVTKIMSRLLADMYTFNSKKLLFLSYLLYSLKCITSISRN